MSTCHDLAKRLRVVDFRLFGEPENDGTNVLEVRGARPSDRVVQIGDLEQDVDERAALEVVAVEPLVENVEDRE
jgi:hypothetical protein